MVEGVGAVVSRATDPVPSIGGFWRVDRCGRCWHPRGGTQHLTAIPSGLGPPGCQQSGDCLACSLNRNAERGTGNRTTEVGLEREHSVGPSLGSCM